MAFKCKRWTLANILPVAFVLGTIGVIWILYVWLHLLPLFFGQVGHAPCMTQLRTSSKAEVIAVYKTMHEPECISAALRRGTVQTFIQQVLTILMLICFSRAASTDPGSVPDNPEWLPQRMTVKRGPEEVVGSESDRESKKVKLRKQHEVKHTGARRFCKWCNRFKPDRSHHCRVCRSCILRMDHHCPWIANCVGFRNHKYFFLLVLYSLLDCAFVIATLSETLYRSLGQDTHFVNRFLIVFCMTLAVMMGVLLTLFLSFHCWLMFRALTTIEFCEKTMLRKDSGRDGKSSIYDRGILSNVRAVLGSNILFWFLPMSPPAGDGLYFNVDTDPDSDHEASALLSGANSKARATCHSRSPEKVETPEVTPNNASVS